ncbi:nucleolar RNA-binding Nop10p family protein [Nanoarchaeota archaeon]
MKHILKCDKCRNYTMQEKHSCGGLGINPKPAKWQPDDKYGRLRREAKKKEFEEKGYL